ncbi:unnamed protein product, partial [Nesidiocoris tenuis]
MHGERRNRKGPAPLDARTSSVPGQRWHQRLAADSFRLCSSQSANWFVDIRIQEIQGFTNFEGLIRRTAQPATDTRDGHGWLSAAGQ